jgi:hypothetical protein
MASTAIFSIPFLAMMKNLAVVFFHFHDFATTIETAFLTDSVLHNGSAALRASIDGRGG